MSNDIDTFFPCEILFSDLLISDDIGGNFFAVYDFVKLIAADVLVVLLDILLSALSVSLLLSFDHSFYMNSNWSVTKYLVVWLGKLIDFSCLWIIISKIFDLYLRCIFINNLKISFTNNIIMNDENCTYIFEEEGNGRTYPAQLCSYLNSFLLLV